MEPTILDDSKKPEKICPNCSCQITTGNAKRIYCSDNCRVSKHAKAKKQKFRVQEQTMNEQRATIDRLADAPVQRRRAVQVINPEWQLANQVYVAQKALCSNLENQLNVLQVEIHRVKGGNRGANYGAAIAIALVLYFMASRYDIRKSNPLNSAFAVTSLSFLIGAGIVGFWTGKVIHSRLITLGENDNAEWSHSEQKRHELVQRLGTEKKELQRLYKQIVKLNQYESETITTVQETRVLTSQVL